MMAFLLASPKRMILVLVDYQSLYGSINGKGCGSCILQMFQRVVFSVDWTRSSRRRMRPVGEEKTIADVNCFVTSQHTNTLAIELLWVLVLTTIGNGGIGLTNHFCIVVQ